MRKSLLAMCTFGIALALPAPALAQAVGINAAIRNKVMTRKPAQPALAPAVLKARVALGEQVVTAPASMLQILLLDRSNFTVGANARVTIDRFVYDPARSASAVGASVARGAFRFMSGRPVRNMPGKTSITTPVASIGVRGTIFEGVVGADALRIAGSEAGAAEAAGRGDGDSATLVVLRGPAATATQPGGAIDVTANGQTVAVDQPGMAVFIPGPGQDPVGPFLLSDDGLLALHDLLRTTPDLRDDPAGIHLETNPIVDQTLEELPPSPQGDIVIIDGGF
jgi:FecR protein